MPGKEYIVTFWIGHFIVKVCNQKHDVVTLTVCFHSCGAPFDCSNPWRCSPAVIPLSRLKSYLVDAINFKHIKPTPDSKQWQVSNPKVNHDTVESWLTLARWLLVNPVAVKCIPGLYVSLCSYSIQLFGECEIIAGVDKNRKIMDHFTKARGLFDMQVNQEEKRKKPITLKTDMVRDGTYGAHTINQTNNPEYTTCENAYIHNSLNELINHVFTGDTFDLKNAIWIMKNRNNLCSIYNHDGIPFISSQILNNGPFVAVGKERRWAKMSNYHTYAIDTRDALNTSM
jgi:hypothetical protein